ncbi:MAG: hypothetical protein JWN73_3199 [Betaproteobacteria bacterium]|nr:hypothetical protein [Betaproteobacteria bacterium]
MLADAAARGNGNRAPHAGTMRPMEIEFILAAAPGTRIADFDAVPALGQAYARGPVQRIAAPTDTGGYWFARFGIARQGDWPAAPFRLAPEAAGDTYWLCADPIHQQLDGDRLLFDPRSLTDLSAAQAESMVAELNVHLAADGMALQTLTPGEWVLRLPRPFDVAASPPGLAAGQPAAAVLPQGGDAAWARRLSSEVQMLLYQAAANAERESQRRWPVNSLWLWGGGTRPAAGVALAPHHQIVLSPQSHVREICRAAGGQAADLPADWAQAALLLDSMHCDKALIDLTEIAQNPAWQTVLQLNWLSPAALAPKKQKLTFWAVFSSPGESLRVRLYRSDLFHFFRRKSLARALDRSQNPGNS